MKKQMSLAEQVKDAQKAVNGWSSEKRQSVRLEGSGIHQSVGRDRINYTETLRQPKRGERGGA